ncbi:hypothetical protein [Flavobacterium cellulosilyticum]|uniref:Uncharacterized protein n=1 Tax=Flavobacterium cellulosilyticum TaxID=2541731 RepID=A0A4R5CBV2_9FLAO|nr:hypothetical protein [Flavobacterium cellulosilyticum]TDD96895.1 hypothetical protein E0F76_09630 [Flavobacterium cellulosilyticum]
MRALILCHLVLLVQGIGSGQKQQNDFRGFTWGDSFEKVLTEEKAKYVTRKDRVELLYSDVLGGKDVKILYVFNGQSKLIETVYIFARKYNNPERYVLTYNAFSDLITEK